MEDDVAHPNSAGKKVLGAKRISQGTKAAEPPCPESSLLPAPEAVLADSGAVRSSGSCRGQQAADRYLVCQATALADAPRLRALEHEFVRDHVRAARGQRQPKDFDWYAALNVIKSEADAIDAIANHIQRSGVCDKSKHQHFTLRLLHISGVNPVSVQIVGFVHFLIKPGVTTEADTVQGMVEVAHLKVDNCHLGRGLGALLLMGMAEFLERRMQGILLADVRLSVLSTNTGAVKFYTALDFKEEPSSAGKAFTTLLWSRAPKSAAAAFRTICRKRLRAQAGKPQGLSRKRPASEAQGAEVKTRRLCLR